VDGSSRNPDENMENQTSFDLSGAIQKWRRNLAQSAAFRSADLDELEAHLRDAIPALEAAGLSSEESFLIASRRIGTRQALESEFGKINSRRAWLNRPWLAGLLQIVTPGLGNLYSGRPLRGLILHVAVQSIGFFLALALLWLPWPVNFLIPAAAAIVVTIFVVFDGVRCARTPLPDFPLARYNRWYVYILVVAVLAVVVAPERVLVGSPTRAYVIQAFPAPTQSMEPTVLVGDRIVVDKTAYAFSEPKRGDIAFYISTEHPQTIFMKRIVGMPGETIEIRNRQVFVNGKTIDEPYVQFLRPSTDGRFTNGAFNGDSVAPTLIPADAYFLLGDNRDNSNDSRFMGPVQRQQLLGKAKTIYFSSDPETHKPRWNRIGKTPN
jgi:signal peptidase I